MQNKFLKFQPCFCLSSQWNFRYQTHLQNRYPSHSKPNKHIHDTFQTTVFRGTIPSHHILENQIIPFIKTASFCLGLVGVQGTEMCHQTTKILKKKRAVGIKNKLKKMKFIKNSQLLQVNPNQSNCNGLVATCV